MQAKTSGGVLSSNGNELITSLEHDSISGYHVRNGKLCYYKAPLATSSSNTFSNVHYVTRVLSLPWLLYQTFFIASKDTKYCIYTVDNHKVQYISDLPMETPLKRILGILSGPVIVGLSNDDKSLLIWIKEGGDKYSVIKCEIPKDVVISNTADASTDHWLLQGTCNGYTVWYELQLSNKSATLTPWVWKDHVVAPEIDGGFKVCSSVFSDNFLALGTSAKDLMIIIDHKVQSVKNLNILPSRLQLASLMHDQTVLIVSDATNNTVCVFSFPEIKLLQECTGVQNVFVGDFNATGYDQVLTLMQSSKTDSTKYIIYSFFGGNSAEKGIFIRGRCQLSGQKSLKRKKQKKSLEPAAESLRHNHLSSLSESLAKRVENSKFQVKKLEASIQDKTLLLRHLNTMCYNTNGDDKCPSTLLFASSKMSDIFKDLQDFQEEKEGHSSGTKSQKLISPFNTLSYQQQYCDTTNRISISIKVQNVSKDNHVDLSLGFIESTQRQVRQPVRGKSDFVPSIAPGEIIDLQAKVQLSYRQADIDVIILYSKDKALPVSKDLRVIECSSAAISLSLSKLEITCFSTITDLTLFPKFLGIMSTDVLISHPRVLRYVVREVQSFDLFRRTLHRQMSYIRSCPDVSLTFSQDFAIERVLSALRSELQLGQQLASSELSNASTPTALLKKHHELYESQQESDNALSVLLQHHIVQKRSFAMH